MQGTNPAEAQRLQTDLEATQQKLTAEDYTGLSKHQVVGDLLYSTIFSYFALNGVQDAISQRQAGIVSYRAPSYGLFKTSLTPEYWFGIPRDVKADGLGMDVDSYRYYRVDENNDEHKWIAFNRANGARMSAMEHLVPEQMYSTDTAAAHGVSAVKAIQLAAAEGQKVYTITQANVSGALASLQLSSDIETDIRNAVYAGQEVTTHERPVNFFGNESVGYIIIDPNTGAGAYKIGGGENGSEVGGPGVSDGWAAAGVSSDLLSRILSGVISGIKALINFDKCGPGIAFTILAVALVILVVQTWIAAYVALLSVKIMAFVIGTIVSGFLSWALLQTCRD